MNIKLKSLIWPDQIMNANWVSRAMSHLFVTYLCRLIIVRTNFNGKSIGRFNNRKVTEPLTTILLTIAFVLVALCSDAVNSSPDSTTTDDAIDQEQLLEYNVSYAGMFSKAGTDDFYQLRIVDGVVVDKSLLIEEYLREKDGVIVVTRPRKFGKTINAKMLKSFLEIEVDEHGQKLEENDRMNLRLFVGGKIALTDRVTKKYRYLNVSRYEFSMDRQGNVPVIFLSFDSIAGNSSTEIEYSLRATIDKLFNSYKYLEKYVTVEEKLLGPAEKVNLKSFLSKDYTTGQLRESLRFLTIIFYKIFSRKVHVIVDDFDKPVNNFYDLLLGRNYESSPKSSMSELINKTFASKELQQVVQLFRDLFANCFVDNQAYEKAFLTGVQRYKRADVLSAIDDVVLRQYSVLSANFSAYYGFTQHEVDSLIDNYNLERKNNMIDYLYKGYNIAGREMYNPFSLARYFQSSGTAENYWVQSGTPTLIESLLMNNDDHVKERLRILAVGGTIVTNVSDKVTFDNNLYDGLFSSLLHTGYLTPISNICQVGSNRTCIDEYQLTFPNNEVKSVFKNPTKPAT